MSRTPTFQELLADFSNQAFIGRHTHLALFHHTLFDLRPPFLILNVFGQAGMGKTMLLQELCHIAQGYGAATAVSNAQQATILQVIHHLENQFGEAADTFAGSNHSELDPGLSRQFVTNLDKIACQQRLIICFDDYDQTAVFLEEWLCELLKGKFGTFSGQVFFVIASRQPLGRRWLAFHRAIHQTELEAFQEDEARTYLQLAGITDPQTVAHMIQRAQGVPGVLASLAAQHEQLMNSAGLWQQGRSHFEARAYPHALTAFSQAIQLQPENDYLYHWRGRAYWEANDHSSALADFNKAIHLRPEQVTYYHWRGLAYRKRHDYALALADFSKAIALQPHNGDNYWARGYTHREAQNHQAAIADFSKAIELQPDNINFYYWRGRSYLEMRQTENALADFVQIKEILHQKQQIPAYKNGHGSR